MNAIYRMIFGGQAGGGHGIVYIGKGVVIGGDSDGGRYDGHYTKVGDEFDFEVTLSPDGDRVLVTGQPARSGTPIHMTARWPLDFADGSTREITVAGSPVQVVLTLIREIP